MTGKALQEALQSSRGGEVLESLYGPRELPGARRRYGELIEGMLHFAPPAPGPKSPPFRGTYPREFPETAGNLRVFTAPGRTELGGNHTDHNRGKVLAASIQLDSVAVVAPRQDSLVIYRSTGYPDVVVDLADLSPNPAEEGATEALIRGIAAELTARGTPVRGFTANGNSTVLAGSGLSSSAAVEVLIGRIFDCLSGEGNRSALEIARIGQKAENRYFGKPCGLMDQTACASGGAVFIDFGDPLDPRVNRINFDLSAPGYALCVVDTKGSHADLTPDYAAIPSEMKAVAAWFGKTVLREVDPQDLLTRAAEIRKTAGDRALLRALHFFAENRRVDAMRAALEAADKPGGPHLGAIYDFFALAEESGNSSWELLQNVYPPHNPREQGPALALALTREFFQDHGARKGVCRVHGGGFAGTIQAYIPLEILEDYRIWMESFFGPGSVTALRIRSLGAAELEF